jgi:hypothetical protein
VSDGCDQQIRDSEQIRASGLGGGHVLSVTAHGSGIEPKMVELRFRVLQPCRTFGCGRGRIGAGGQMEQTTTSG